MADMGREECRLRTEEINKHPQREGKGEKKYRLYSKSKLPASDYVINPYTGCVHGCLYCYACFMGRFTGHDQPWGTYAEPKKYDSMKLPVRQEGKTILVGSVTDAYQPVEARFCQMPRILECLRAYRGHVEILTKSNLILRDLELLKQIPDISVGVSLGLCSGRDAEALEPRASGIRERLDTLKTLHDNGIPTYLFVAPYFPGITNLRRLTEWSKGFADFVGVENLNLRGGYKAKVMAFIGERHPDLLPLYRQIYEKGGGAAYWKEVEAELEETEKEIEIPFVSYLYHEKIRK